MSLHQPLRPRRGHPAAFNANLAWLRKVFDTKSASQHNRGLFLVKLNKTSHFLTSCCETLWSKLPLKFKHQLAAYERALCKVSDCKGLFGMSSLISPAIHFSSPRNPGNQTWSWKIPLCINHVQIKPTFIQDFPPRLLGAAPAGGAAAADESSSSSSTKPLLGGASMKPWHGVAKFTVFRFFWDIQQHQWST